VGEKMARFSLVLILLQIKLIASSVFYVNFPLETDTVLSSWVLKKYVDNNARFLPIDKLNTKNIRKEQTINTAKSYIRRNARFTAFEMALSYYKISKDKCLANLIQINRILEMTPWKKYEYENVVLFENSFIPLFSKDSKNIDLSETFKYINTYCEKLK
jgi:hypothetical protein